MNTLLLDLRFAFRVWIRSPFLALAAVLSLGLGIGANVTVYTWIRHMVEAPLPGVPGSAGLVALGSEDAGGTGGISYPDFQDLRDENRVFSGLFAGQQVQASLQDGASVQRVWIWFGSWNLFEVLGVRPQAGRFWRREDDRPGQPLGIVLSDGFWRTRLGADPGVLGRTLRIGGKDCRVLGIAPKGFYGPCGGVAYDVFTPLESFIQGGGSPECNLDQRDSRSFFVLGRLRPGVGFPAAKASLAVLARSLEERHPDTNRGTALRVYRMREAPMGAPVLLARPMALVFTAAAFLLLIATANVANLLLAKAAGREREMALRSALGAQRARLAQQVLVESLVLGLAGGALGVLVTLWGLPLMDLAKPTAAMPVVFETPFDAASAAFAFLLSVASAAGFGMLPALRFWRGQPADALKEGSMRAGAGPGIRRAQGVLAVAEMAVAVALLAAAGLMVRSAWEIRHDSPGFRPQGLLFADLGMDLGGYAPEEASRLAHDLHEAVRGLPGVVSATFSEGMPLSLGGPRGVGAAFEGLERPADERLGFARNLVGPDFFRTFGIPLRSGREFTWADDGASQPVVIVNETVVRRFFGGGDPVGRRMKINGEWRQIVGVAGDFKFSTWNDPATEFVFIPFDQWKVSCWNLAVRTTGPAADAAVRKAVAARAPFLPVLYRDMAVVAGNSAFLVKASAVALGSLGLMALALASVGVYGVLAHAVGQRTSEIGVRMAMGATPGRILAMVMRDGLALAAGGVALGLAGAFSLGRSFQSVLHRTGPADPLVFLAVPLGLLAVAALATALPALRAARIPPALALRRE